MTCIKRKQHVVIRKKTKVIRWKYLLNTILWLLLITGITGIGYIVVDRSHAFIVTSPYFKIKDIDITGTSIEEAEKMSQVLKVRKGDNIFFFRSKEVIRKLLEAHPEILNALLRRKFPDKLIIHIQYRNPIARIAFGERMVCVDEEGVIFKLPGLDQKEMFLPQVISSGQSERKMLVTFLKYWQEYNCSLGKDIIKLKTEIPLDIVYYLSDGTKIAWGKLDEELFEQKFERLQIVYRDATKRFKNLRYVNVRYWQDGRILIRPRGSVGKEEVF